MRAGQEPQEGRASFISHRQGGFFQNFRLRILRPAADAYASAQRAALYEITPD